MSAHASGTALPQGIGRITPGWLAIVGLAAVAVALGIYAYSLEASEGLVVTGLRDLGTMGGATWGLYVTFVVYFGGVAFGGVTLAALIRLLRLDELRPIGRLGQLLTVVALLLAAIAILVDLGQPLRGLVNLFLYARPQSPFFGTFTIVLSGYLFASLVYLYLDGRRDAAICARAPSRLRWLYRLWAAGYGDSPEERARHRRASFWLALAIVPLLVVATSTLGFVFGLQAGRPGWYSAVQAPAFVTLAGVSGVGLLIVLAAVVRRVAGSEDRLGLIVFGRLGGLLLGLVLVYLFLLATELFTATYTGEVVERRLTEALLWGEFAGIFWAALAFFLLSLALLLWQALTRRWSIPLLVVAGLLVNLAAIGKRYLIIVPSQTHGQLLPYPQGLYTPALGEFAVIAGLFGLGVLLIALFMKVFPVIELPESEDATDA